MISLPYPPPFPLAGFLRRSSWPPAPARAQTSLSPVKVLPTPTPPVSKVEPVHVNGTLTCRRSSTVDGIYILNGNDEDMVRILELSDTGWMRVQSKAGESWVNVHNLTIITPVSKEAAAQTESRQKADFIRNGAQAISDAIDAYATRNNLAADDRLQVEGHPPVPQAGHDDLRVRRQGRGGPALPLRREDRGPRQDQPGHAPRTFADDRRPRRLLGQVQAVESKILSSADNQEVRWPRFIRDMSDPTTPTPAHSPGHDSNPDPITGEPGAHPVGTGVGAASAGAAGAAIGAVAGPIGVVAGTVIGAVAGGLAGKGVAESIDPTNEDGYWQANHHSQPYALHGSYERFSPAYRTGYEGVVRHGADKDYADVEDDLKSTYEQGRDKAGVSWDNAKHAVRAAYDRARDSVKKA